MYERKGPSHAGSRGLTNGVFKQVRRKNLMIGYCHNGPRNERWLVKTRRISPVRPPSQVITVKNNVNHSAGASSPLKLVRNPEIVPDHTARQQRPLMQNSHWPEGHNLSHIIGQIQFVLALVYMGQIWESCSKR